MFYYVWKTFISQTFSFSERYDFSIERRRENIHKTESPEHNVISLLGQLRFSSLHTQLAKV